MLRRVSSICLGVLCLTILGFSFTEGYAHIPQGLSLKVTKEVGNYTLRVMVYPGNPEVNKTSEIIAGIISSNTNSPYRGWVEINNIQATEFSPGFYEIDYIFKEAGNASVRVEFTQDGETEDRIVTVEVREAYPPGWLFLGGMLFVVSLVLISVGYLKNKKAD